MHSEEQHPTSKHETCKQTGTTTIFTFGYQSGTWKLSGPSFGKNPCSGCNSGINLVVVLEYTFLSLKPTAVKVALLFLLDVRCPTCPHSLFAAVCPQQYCICVTYFC